MKKWILGAVFLILFFMPIPLVWHSKCKAGLSQGIFYECPRLPEGTKNLWDGYFLIWGQSVAQRFVEKISPQILCLFNQCLNSKTLPITK